jgi:hypothetical protein
MKSVRRSTPPRIRLGGLALALGLWVSGLGSASAEPSAGCRDLAAHFATAAAELDLGALAGLMTCVSAEMQDRTGAPVVTSPRGSPASPSAPRTGDRGEWPPPPPWGSPWPSVAPWPSVGPDVR